MDPLELLAQGRLKRYFRASRKLNVPNIVFHITQRAVAKELLFVEDSDYLFTIWLLKEIASKYSLRLYAFCLMPNHIHLLLSPTEANLYDAMRDLFSRYAMKFNRKYERKGHLFGSPYRQAICLDDTYLLAASLYIHANPVRDGIVGGLDDWPYSNYLEWIGERDGKLFDRKFVDTYFETPEDYSTFVLDYLLSRELPEEIRIYIETLEK